MRYLLNHLDDLWALTIVHLRLSLVPIVLGLLIAVPLGGICTFFLGLDVGDVHALAANVLMIVVLGHALMALYHQYVLKDGLLRRMMRAG